jgi:SAM-dependent methyltransferase
LSDYAFGDSELARERLAIVAETFAPPTVDLLQSLPPTFVRYVIDVGCGPGHTTALLRAEFPLAEVTGFDASEAMIAEAAARVPRATFAVLDVTEPLLLPADIVFSRLLLGHLRDPRAALANWARSLRPGNGLLVCEEPVRYRGDDELLARYESAVTQVVVGSGATLWAGTTLDADVPGTNRVLDRVVEHPVPVRRAAAMFWRNATQWRDRSAEADELIAQLRAVEESDRDDVVVWELRQVAFRKRRA